MLKVLGNAFLQYFKVDISGDFHIEQAIKTGKNFAKYYIHAIN